MVIKKEYIGSQVLVPQLGIFVTIKEGQEEDYFKLGLFHVLERKNVIIIQEPAVKRGRNRKRAND
jgi:hypothetical protein